MQSTRHLGRLGCILALAKVCQQIVSQKDPIAGMVRGSHTGIETTVIATIDVCLQKYIYFEEAFLASQRIDSQRHRGDRLYRRRVREETIGQSWYCKAHTGGYNTYPNNEKDKAESPLMLVSIRNQMDKMAFLTMLSTALLR